MSNPIKPAKPPIPDSGKQTQQVAYHEAGHAVVAWRLGRKFKHVTIAPNAKSLGHVSISIPPALSEPRGRDRGLTLDRVIVAFAGELAQAKFRGSKARLGYHDDLRAADDLANRLCISDKTFRACLRYCRLASQDLVDRDWTFIEKVAAALIERKTLEYSEVVKVIHPFPPAEEILAGEILC